MLTRDPSMFMSYRVFRGTEPQANSDHRLVVESIRLQPYRRPQKPRQKKLNTESLLEDDMLAVSYNVTVNNRFQAFGHIDADPEVAWSTVCSAILDVASEVIGYRRIRNRPWLSENTLGIIDQKRDARLQGNVAEHRRLKGVYNAKAK